MIIRNDCVYSNSTLEAALRLAAAGVSVIPIASGTKQPPRRFRWREFQSRIAEPAEIRDWLEHRNDLGLAIICGAVSGGLAVRDFDTVKAYRAWRKRNAALARQFPTVRTSRGYHVYCRISGQRTVTFQDGELRGEGSYVVCPPTPHPGGGSYQWLVPFPPSVGAVPAVEATLFLPKESSSVTDHVTDQLICNIDLFQGGIREAVLATLPTRPGQRNRRVFELACKLRLLGLAGPDEQFETVKTWHRLAFDRIRTKPFQETWKDFVEAWHRFDPARDTVVRALAETLNSSEHPAAERYESDIAKLLVGICAVLARDSPDGVFFLSCRKAAAALGVDHLAANRMLNLLVADGVLEIVEQGGPHSNKATRYRFLGK